MGEIFTSMPYKVEEKDNLLIITDGDEIIANINPVENAQLAGKELRE